MSFSCLFSLSTNDNAIIACKVVVVLRDFGHIYDFTRVLLLPWTIFFQKCINCIAYI